MTAVFRRYKSTIYGNYRWNGLLWGAAMGLVMYCALVLYNLLSPTPLPAPENYLTELAMAAVMLACTWMYRRRLSDGKVTLKELMLLNIWAGCTAAVLYGLLTWLHCGAIEPGMTQHYVEGRLAVMPDATESAEAAIAVDKVCRYTAGDWGFIAGFRCVPVTIFIAFVYALIFRTEKAEVRTKKEKQ